MPYSDASLGRLGIKFFHTINTIFYSHMSSFFFLPCMIDYL